MSDLQKIATRYGSLKVEKQVENDALYVTLNSHLDRECVFHWGLSRTPKGRWLLPPQDTWPENTRPHDNDAAQTLVPSEGSVSIRLGEGQYAELPFALYFPQSGDWDNNHGMNYRVALLEMREEDASGKPADEELQDIALEIIQKETSRNSWTLMHRYNLCHELLDRVGGSREGLALLFVWLRFSALRQLDWQRNYNTKPRELSHAQQRLTSRLARIYTEQPAQRDLVRLMLTTMGHGGEGQRIRDEILEIMHRHRIKEVSGIFMEQWHQKMHNNTTPDDIVICEAYLAFLRSDGDPDTFYRSLQAGGVTRHRLEGFERPITVDPEFYPDKKDALISDFEHFLETLKSVHSATDLGTRMQAAEYHFDDRMHRLADFIWDRRDAAGEDVTALLRKVTDLRGLVIRRLKSDVVAPDLLCLDVAMEDFIRTVVERNLQSHTAEQTLFEALTQAGDNFLLAHADQDLSFCMLQWKRIWKPGTSDADLILQAESILDRIERTVSDYVHRYQGLFQPKAEFLGKSFHAEPWTIRLFSEEVMRGGLIFALSVLSHHLRRLLRERARLPSWQPVSPGSGSGRVEVTHSLDALQGRRFDPPAIIVSDGMRGDEDLPEGVVAILTSGTVDVVSHVAIRARNQGVLLATCYDEAVFEELKAWEGQLMAVEIDAAGEVHLEPTEKQNNRAGAKDPRSFDMDLAKPPDAPYAISVDRFQKGLVGAKSLHLKELRERLPDWIHLPVSIALPFGTLEKVLKTKANRDVRGHYDGLLKRVEGDPSVLEDLRRTLMRLAQPHDLDSALMEVMKNAGIPTPENTERIWKCVKRVWASKWNDRAYLNRRAFAIPHDKLLMAVLIQEVVPAEMAYIIHTVHPFSGNREEVYVEAVLGFGETLAANYPGRALSCSWNKKSGVLRLLGYPSKSIGLYGKGLIFRSDSNAEDLSGYAGAGLYSSFPLDSLKEVHLNYTEEPLVQDKAFQREFLSMVGKLGVDVEEAMGSPQDIEGAFAEGRYYVVQTRSQVGLGA